MMFKIRVEKSIKIKASVEKIAESLSSFKEWSSWSPWLIMDPEAVVKVAEDEKSYSWEGKRVGAGNMTIQNITGNEKVDYKLVFLKPWKSKADVSFVMKADGNESIVT